MTFGHVTLFDVVANSIEIIGMFWIAYKQDQMLDRIEKDIEVDQDTNETLKG